LTTAVRAASAGDPAIVSSLANRDAALEAVEVAHAKLRPQLSLQSTNQHLEQTTSSGPLSSNFSGRAKNTQLSLRQALLRRRDSIGVDVAKEQAELVEARIDWAHADLWARTANAWIDVLAAQAMREVYQRTLGSTQVSAEQEASRFKSGEGTREAVAEAAAQRSLAAAQLAEAKLSLQGRLAVFNQLTRLDVVGFGDVAFPPVQRLTSMTKVGLGLLDRVLDANPDLMAARAGVRVNERRLAQASADHWPTLDLVAGHTEAQNDTANTLGLRYRSNAIGVQLLLPLYAGGGINASERQAASSFVAAQADVDALAQKLKVQFNEDWHAQAGLQQRIEAAIELVNAANEQRRAMEANIRRGFKTWADLGAADQLLARREGELVGTVAQLFKTQARLLSLLPINDPAWQQWIGELSRWAVR
jgi:outer membrane protein TolC